MKSEGFIRLGKIVITHCYVHGPVCASRGDKRRSVRVKKVASVFAIQLPHAKENILTYRGSGQARPTLPGAAEGTGADQAALTFLTGYAKTSVQQQV